MATHSNVLGESQGQRSLLGCDLWGRTESDMTEATQQQQQQRYLQEIRDTKGTLYAKMGTIKDRNGKDLTESEDIKKNCTEKVMYITNYDAKGIIIE